MAIKLYQFYDLDLNDFVGMLAEHEVERRELSSIKMQIKKERKIVKSLTGKVIDMTSLKNFEDLET